MKDLVKKAINGMLRPLNLVVLKKTTLEHLEEICRAARQQEKRNKPEEDELATFAMRRRRDNWLETNILNTYDNSYVPTFSDFDRFIDDSHEKWTKVPVDGVRIVVAIPGSLRQADALKLYEMAYYSRGDILELGTSMGLSSSVMAEALRNSRNQVGLFSVDVLSQNKAKENLAKAGFDGAVTFIQGDGTSVCKTFIDDKHLFSFVFVDHSHRYQEVVEICELLEDLLVPGGYVMFHDFIHKANTNKDHRDYEIYGVPHAILDALPAEKFDFLGLCGGSALYMKKVD